jgi:hypothetical protein
MIGTPPAVAERVDPNQAENNTIEASMSLKTKICISKRTQIEYPMRALNPTFELFGIAELQAAVSNRRRPQESKSAEPGEAQRIATKYKTVGTKLRSTSKQRTSLFSMLHISRVLCAHQSQSDPKGSARRQILRKRSQDSRLASGCGDCDK